jgi:hypothetical protein
MLLALVEELAPERLLAAEVPLVAGLVPGLVVPANKALMLLTNWLNGLLEAEPLEVNELPLELNELPLEMNELPLELNELPLELNEPPLVLEGPKPLDELLPNRSLKKALTGLLLEELLPENELLLPENELLPEVEELGTAIEISNTRETPVISNESLTRRFLAGSRPAAASEGGVQDREGHSA